MIDNQKQEIIYFLPDYMAAKGQPLQAVRPLTEELKVFWLDKKEAVSSK